jgi:hypothetical protein
MPPKSNRKYSRLFSLLLVSAISGAFIPGAYGASCTTASEMTAAQRDIFSSVARTIVSQVQSGDVQGLRANTIPAVAADFSGIASSAEAMRPLLQKATITVNNLYAFDSSHEQASQNAQFFCAPPNSNLMIVLNFSNLPSGKYAAVILHATGVPQPQQISLVLSQTEGDHWKLAGFFSKPMLTAGHDGIWYWTQARQYSEKKMNWNAWFYYQNAAFLLDPVDFISSPNLEKLKGETDRVRPQNLPGANPMSLTATDASFQVTGLETSSQFGGLDLVVYYNPDATQASQLHDPVTARKQALDIMQAMLNLHPELRSAFHGIWVRANQGGTSVFALELPMDQIAGSRNGPST